MVETKASWNRTAGVYAQARRGALDVLLVTVRLGPGVTGREEALGSRWLL